MQSSLSISSADLEWAKRDVLYKSFAPAIQAAIEAAIREHLQTVDERALPLLSEADFHLMALCSDNVLKATTFGPQGEYWATLSPSIETLLNLAREELTRILPEFRQELRKPFDYVKPRRGPSPRTIWKERTLSKKFAQISCKLSWILHRCVFVEHFNDGGQLKSRDATFCPQLFEKQREAISQCVLLRQLDARLERCVVGVRYRSAGERMVEIGANAFKLAVQNSGRSWEVSVPHRRFGRWSFARSTLLVCPSIALAAIASASLINVNLGVGEFCGGLVWAGWGAVHPFLRFQLEYRKALPEIVSDEVKNCQEDVVDYLPENIVDRVVNGMTAELAPRPLQRLMLDAGLLRG
jgi:hypothetical protein